MDIASYQVIWFVLWSVLWAVYFMLDGFVLGTGMLHLCLGRTDTDRRVLIHSVGPVWDGNEVWLLTAGGATFAAFPTAYALMFSYLYAALLLLLFTLIIRGVSLEFRGKLEGAGWKRVWDAALFACSLLPALLLGVAFGNIFRGLPMDASGHHGGLPALLNPYGLVTGLLFVLLFAVHGALYVAIKTTGDLAARAQRVARGAWPALLAVAVAFLVHTRLATRLYDNSLAHPALFAVPLTAVAAMLGLRLFLAADAPRRAFACSCVTIVAVVATGVAGLFPNLIPSSLDAAYNLTIYNTSSSLLTLKIMTVVALVFVPLVIAYKIWVYRIFRAPITPESLPTGADAY
jgi:cytochrome d ubiquinol oxidase subunit II